MLKPGLVSVTFRQLSASEIIHLVKRANLTAIEWGGDIHVPQGDIATARLVGKMTTDAGLEVAAYGSYYRFTNEIPFEDVLETAVELGAPTIRVWAGTEGSESTTYARRSEIVTKSHYIAKMAASAGIKVAFEYHSQTLTDTIASAVKLLEEVNHPNMYSYWQPLSNQSIEDRLAGLMQIKPWLSNIHVYHWNENERMPLSNGDIEWIKYIKLIHDLPETHYALLEFVKDNDPAQFLADAKYFLSLLDDVEQGRV